ncbi:MAG: helix-turn-helix domain-containing protein [Blautia sp.]|nr:helix-turn-helix domain-containing protein [Blautia sp.]
MESRLLNSQEEKEAALYEYDIQVLQNLILGYHTEKATLSSQKLMFINQAHRSALFTAYFEKTPEDGLIRNFSETRQMGDLLIVIPDPNDRQTLFLLLFLPGDNVLSAQPYLRKTAEELVSFLEHQGYPCLLGISSVHSDLSQLKDAFLESTGALNRQPVSSAFLPGVYENQDTEQRLIHWDRQDEFLFRIESGSSEETAVLTDLLFQYYESVPDFTLADAKYHCYLLSVECRRLLSDYLNQPDARNDSESMQNVTRHIFRIAELKKYYRQFFLNLAGLMKEQTVYSQEDVIENIRIYMERNYQKDLTQEFISCLFYINRSYLSTLFKARTGEKFVDYLNNIRIEKAKELLSGSDRRMYQIAKSVGYDNVKYFFRIFKKKTGMTPEQFRAEVPLQTDSGSCL